MRRSSAITTLIYLLQFRSNHSNDHSLLVRAHEDDIVHAHTHTHAHNAEHNAEHNANPTQARVEAAGRSAWSRLDVKLPIPLSDMAVSLLNFPGFESTKQRIVLSGGCNHPRGNVLTTIDLRHFGIDNCLDNCILESFQCTSLSNKLFAFTPSPPSSSGGGEWGGHFMELAEMPRKRSRHANAAIVVQGRHLLCLLGGRDERDELIGEIDCYNPESNSWITPASLPRSLRTSDGTAIATASHGSDSSSTENDETSPNPTTIHLIGGYDEDYTALNTVTSIDFSNLDNIQFSSGPPMLTERGDIDSVIVAHPNGEQYAYVSGGFTHLNDYSTPHNSVERIAIRHLASRATTSTTRGVWHEVGKRDGGNFQERGDKQLVALNGRIYALGGETRVDPVAAISEERVYALGDESVFSDTVEMYVPGGGNDLHWSKLDDMPVVLHRFAASEWEEMVEGDEDLGLQAIFVFGGQVEYDADCECFRTTDRVLAFEPEIAERGAGGMADPARAGEISSFRRDSWVVKIASSVTVGVSFLFWVMI